MSVRDRALVACAVLAIIAGFVLVIDAVHIQSMLKGVIPSVTPAPCATGGVRC